MASPLNVEDENSLSRKSWSKFNSGNYQEALDALHQLAEEMSPIKDVRLLHNIKLTEFSLGKYTYAELEDALKSISPSLESSQFSDHETDSNNKLFSPTQESIVLKYNLAALQFQKKQYSSAATLLESLFRNLGPGDEPIAMHICFLYMDTLLHSCRGCLASKQDCQYAINKLVMIMNFLEKPHSFNGITADSNDVDADKPKDDPKNNNDLIEFRFRFHLYNSKILLLQDNAKAAKKEVKSALEIFQKEIKHKDGDKEDSKLKQWRESSRFNYYPPMAMQSTSALYLKANLEFRRQNYKKSIKLLSSCQKDSYPDYLYSNNMGCIYYQMQRRGLAQLCYSKALGECLASDQKQHSMGRTQIKVSQECEILYNNGLVLLMSGSYSAAFKCFYSASRVYFNRLRLWLAMGECCMMQHTQQSKDFLHKGYTNSIIRSVVGSGKHRRILLSVKNKVVANINPVGVDDSTSDSIKGIPPMTLHFAAKCFRNVLALLAKYESNSDSSLSSPTADSSRHSLIHQAALANLSYVYLCFKEPVLALENARKLLELSDCSDSYRYLGRSYCSQAFSMQSRPLEALEKLQSDESCPNTKTSDLLEEYCKACPTDLDRRVALDINLANIYILQENLPVAEQYITKALESFPTSMEGLRVLVYILLRKGSSNKAVQVMKQGRIPLRST